MNPPKPSSGLQIFGTTPQKPPFGLETFGTAPQSPLSASTSAAPPPKSLTQGPIPPLSGSKQLGAGCVVVPLRTFRGTYAPHAPLLGPTTALGSPHTPPKPRPTSPKPRPVSLPAAPTPAPVPVHSPPGLSVGAPPHLVRGRGLVSGRVSSAPLASSAPLCGCCGLGTIIWAVRSA